MPALKIVKIGNPVLRAVTQDIPADRIASPEMKAFVKSMIDTMHKAEGVGLAANQVGKPWRIFVMECKKSRRYPESPDVPLQVYFNARILETSGEPETDAEGCLSIPGYRGPVPRKSVVVFEALDENGMKVRRTARGFEARIVQHEIDHLNGFFYVDRMPDLKKWGHLEELNQDLPEE